MDRDVSANQPIAQGDTPGRNVSVSFEHWREAMAQLRHLDNEVWVGLRTFLTANGFLVAAVAGLLGFGEPGRWGRWLVFALCIVGLLLTLVGRYILKRHRVYYLQMLLKKTLLEHELGFYDTRLGSSTTDLAFPWRLGPELAEALKRTPEAWVQQSIRGPGTIARFQFWVYEGLLVLYAAALLFALFSNRF